MELGTHKCSLGYSANANLQVSLRAEQVMSQQVHTGIEITTPSALLAEGLERHAAGNFATAAQRYRQSLNLRSQNPDALLLLGIIARQLLQFENAIALIKAAIKMRPAPHYYLHLARVYRDAGRFAEAETVCRRAIALSPLDATDHCALAEVLIDCRSFAAALHYYQQALSVNPALARAHSGIGNILCKQGNFSAAAACYRRALSLAPQRAEFHFRLGYVLHRIGDSRNARASFARALTNWRAHDDRHAARSNAAANPFWQHSASWAGVIDRVIAALTDQKR